jgi:GWxTD domain-containing protein
MKNRMIFSVMALFMLGACFNLNKLSLYNLSGQYSNTKFTQLEVVAINHASDSVTLMVPLRMDDMAIAEDESTGKSFNQVRLAYELFETYDSKEILDSASQVVRRGITFPGDTLVTFSIAYPGRQKYVLKLELIDMNRVDAVSEYVCLDNSTPFSATNFLLSDPRGNIIFSNIVGAWDEVVVLTSHPSARKIFVRHYNRDFPLALPPFMEETQTTFDYRADSVFSVDLEEGKSGMLIFPKEGFYHLQLDTGIREGYTVYRFYEGFPDVVSTEQMLWPLRYITTKAEFDEILDAADHKLAIDNFWLNNGGNPARARSMIQKYYSRVTDANSFFTSYHEGWKTDRGLIYIVYGPPSIVYRGDGTEEWLYGEKGNANSIRFSFVKVVNPFSENDYSLIKSPSYKEKWYNIVGSWRR